MNLEKLNFVSHKTIKVDTSKVEYAGYHERSIPVVLSEFQKVAIQNPIVFTKNDTTGRFVPIAMYGFDTGENLSCSHHSWDGVYIPLNITRQPFFAGQGEGDSKFSVCIDVDNIALTEPGENSQGLFNDDGSATPYLERMKETLVHLLEEEQRLLKFVETLLEFDLVTPLNLDITLENQEQQHIDGLYTIAEDKLNALPEAELIKLRSLGYLKPIYSMMLSMDQIYVLVDKKNKKIKNSA